MYPAAGFVTGESWYGADMPDREGSSIAQRAAAILRQELADGALANIARTSTIWASPPRDLMSAVSRARNEFEDLAATVLDVLASGPAPRPHVAAAPQYADATHVLQSLEPGVAGAPTELRARLRNDSRHPVDMSFACTDLVAASGQRISSAYVVLSPSQLHLQPGDEVDVRIRIHVPENAAAGVYRGLLQATNSNGPRALVQVPIV